MLDELNRYAHGYIAVPVILACRRGGLFALLEERGPISVESAADALGANRGYLRIAWRLLRSLGWLEAAGGERFALTDSARTALVIPDELQTLLDFDFDGYLDGRGSLDAYIRQSEGRWGIDDPVAADLLDGVFVVPLLVMAARRQSLEVEGDAPFAGVPSPARGELQRLFANKEWLSPDAAGPLTSEGRFMLERAMNTATVLSYRPMMKRVGELLFGDARAVFERLEDGHESHVDRTLNVIGSGFQHEKYFRDLDEVILSIFDREPFADQPHYVADMGSGDGTLLKRVYEVVRDRSARGKVLDEYPLTMVGLDYNDASLTETSRTLADVPHMTLHADIGDPAAMLADLKAAGIDEPDRILHIRSFLDHDRPYKAPRKPVSREHLAYHGVYVEKGGGDIPPAEAIQSLTEHLERWAELGSRHGLIIIEVHCLDPETVRTHLSESENLHFDAMQAFSGQLLVEADVFVLAAAEAGLFPTPRFALRYPKILPFCRITQNRFENRSYRARNARSDDIPALARLEELCWEEPIRTPTSVIAERIRQHPDDICVFEQNGAITGVLYAQRIDDTDALKTSRYRDVPGIRRERGQVMQLLGFNVDPEVQGLGYADEFMEFGLHWLSLKPGVRSIVGVSRCAGFKAAERPLEEYVRACDDAGVLLDPILRFHQLHGAEVRGLVPGYRPEDTVNLGTGVLIEYAPDRRLHKAEAVANATATDKSAGSPGLSLERLTAMLVTLLGEGRKDAIAPDRPLRQIGLDSLDLLEFRTMLSRETGQKIEPTFFFQYSTLRAISEFLSGGAARPVATATRRARPAESSPIAIVGASCRFPGGSSSPEALWDLLANGRDAVTEVPVERRDFGAMAGGEAGEWRRAMRYGGFLDGIDLFDAAFFDIAPREARLLDPQQRLMLELCWEALENAAIDPTTLAGSDAGVFAGLFSHDYEYLQLLARPDSIADIYFATGTNSSVAAGRVAYVLGLQGPALAVNTACSSSLVAVHLACQAMRNGECGLALAGGVNVMLAPQLTETFARANMLAPDGRCKTFDAAANGYVRSEGAAIVVLKPLARAQADGDRILGVIRGSAINQDGASNGLTAPSAFAQQDVIERALRDAEVEPADVSYLEAHGTGTALGDPVEVAAIAAAYGRGRGKDRPLVLGSLKTNIGHAESAAGIGGLLKVILSLQHERIPPHLHFEKPNPHLDLDAVPAVVPAQGLDWPSDGERRRIAAISSFGFSGTNAHVIVEEAPAAPPRAAAAAPFAHVLALSARSAPALAAQARRFAEYLESREGLDIADVCHTANSGRAHLEHRLAVVGEDLPGMAAGLRDFAAGRRSGVAWMTSAVSGARGAAREKRRIGFLFGSRGDGWRAVARALLASEPVFRDALERCDAVLARDYGQPLIARIEEPDGAEAGEAPALLAVQYALCELMRSWGIEPGLVIGHGAGECAAAVAAGVLGIEDGLKLAAARASVLRRAANGARLAAVHADAGTVQRLLDPLTGKAAVAAVNGAAEVIVSTTARGAAALARRCKKEGIGCLLLDAASPVPIGDAIPADGELERVAAALACNAPRVPLISCAAGGIAGPDVASPGFWRRQAAQPANLAGAAAALLRAAPDAVLEIGPATALPALVRKAAGQSVRGEWLAGIGPGISPREAVLRTLARLHVIGGQVDWAAFDRGRGVRKVALPGYAFQRERYWFDDAEDGGAPLTRDRLVRAALRSRVTDGDTVRRFAKRVNPALDRICAGFVVAALESLGWRPRAGDELTPAALRQELGILPRHERLVARMLEMLAEDGLLSRQGAAFAVAAVPRPVDPARELRELAAEHADLSVELALLGRCGPELANVLRGACDPLQLIFPDGDLDGATQFYEDTPFSRDCNAMMAGAVDAIVRQAPGDRPLRVLELGAGTGGTTSHLLPRLPAGRTEYTFTDVSPLFTARAAERFADYPFVAYRLLDIARDPASQGFLPASFDVVIASNVLHATPDMRASLRHARQLLAPGGRLLLVEGTARTRWIDLIFGLTEGWWLFEDADLRPSHPLLANAAWLTALGECGYSDAAIVPNADLRGGALFAQALVMGSQPASLAPEQGPVRLLGERISPAGEPDVYLFDAPLDLRRHAWLGDHKVDGNVVFPAAAYIEMALAAARELPKAAAFSLQRLELQEALFLDDATSRRVQLKAIRRGGSYDIEIYSARAGGRDDGAAWQRHARGRLEAPAEPVPGALSPEPAADTGDAVEHGAHYGAMRALGLDYGPRFRGVESLTRTAGRVVARLRRGTPPAGFVFDPAVADAALQSAVALAAQAAQPSDAQSLWLPVRCAEAAVPGNAGPPVQAIAIAGSGASEGDCYVADVTALDESGREALIVRGLELRRVERTTLTRGSTMLHRLAWMAAPLPDAGAPAGGPWLVATAGDGGGDGARLAAALGERGIDCDVLDLPLAGDRKRALRAQLEALQNARAAPWRQVVYLATAAAGVDAEGMTADPMADQQRLCGGLLLLVQALAAQGREVPELQIVTRGALAAGDEPAGLTLAHTTLAGLRRVVALECPELRCRHLDLDGGTGVAQAAERIVAETAAGREEDEVAWRGDARLVSRLIRHSQAGAPGDRQVLDGGRPVELVPGAGGTLEGLRFAPAEPPMPGAGEVSLRVLATGLNFKDVLNVIGFRDGQARPGLEAAGVVTAVGAGVDRFRVGDRVAAIGTGGFASYMTTAAELVVPAPAGLDMARLATIPIAFLTAHWALRHLTRLGPGERVLVHAASGGVGLAAVQLARAAGAVVFGTAGSERKRQWLRTMGVEHVLDSRSLAFADEIRARTQGEGADVVLNCLAGEFIDASLGVVAKNGRFIELGIRDILDAREVAARRPDVAYHTVDLAATIENEPQVLEPMLATIFREIAEHRLAPLPYTCFPLERTAQAFGYMQRARHIGKIVVTQPPCGINGRLDSAAFGRGTYLLTGGLGPLGLATARWLAARGAAHLVLLGRRAPEGEAASAVEALRKSGVQVAVHRCDVTRRAELAAVLRSVADEMPPLAGIFHLAGTLADGVLRDQDWARFDEVLAPKVLGAWHLHDLTREMPLDCFVLYSSWASMLGSPGQANHSAANAFMDALAHHRQALGLPALSVNWAAWKGAGSAMHGDRLEQLGGRGIGGFSFAEALDLLGQLLSQGAPQVAVMPFDVEKWRSRSAAAARSHRFDELEDTAAAEPPRDEPQLAELLAGVPPGAPRLARLRQFVVNQLAVTLNTSGSRIETDASFRALGLDSLTGLELRNRLETCSGLGLPATIVWNYPSVDRLAQYLAKRLADDQDGGEGGAAGDESVATLLEELESLSDEEARHLLARGDGTGE